MRNAYTFLLVKLKGKGPMCKWEENIDVAVKEIGCGLD
jgi:hypothetical protein